MKKGLRLKITSFISFSSRRNSDLMKKGLRRLFFQQYLLLYLKKLGPDEKGIKTHKFAIRCDKVRRNSDLMKKGLRLKKAELLSIVEK